MLSGWRLMALVACSGLMFGCEKPAATAVTKQVMSLGEVPPEVLKAAQAKLPDVKFEAAVRMSNGGYEVKGKTKTGKIREVEVSQTGEVLAVE
jgi:hypothetical protein